MRRRRVWFVEGITIAALLCAPSLAVAQSLGSANSYAVLGGTLVSAGGGGATVTGDVGVSPGTAISGPIVVVAPYGIHANDASAVAAQTSATALYATLAGMGGDVGIDAELGGRTYGPGTYSFTSTANIAAGTVLTLSGAGTYIFQVGSALTANVGSSVVLLGGASACTIFWQVSSSATLSGGSFAGNVVAHDSITLGVGSALTGRALALAAGAVTLSGGNTVGGCSVFGGVCPTIVVSPATLPAGTVGVAYSETLVGSGGAVPYSFSVTTGVLPAGLTLTGAGVLAGTPTAAGTFPVTIRGTDADGCFADQVYSIVIAAPPPPPPVCPVITLLPAVLPGGTVGIAYTQTMTGSGGTAPYVFGVTVGTLPTGLVLTAAGVLAGTPIVAGTSPITIRGTDANACFAEVAYSLVIAAAPPPPPVCPVITLQPRPLPNGTLGVAYSRTLTGTGGTAPYVFGVTLGALPPGLTLTAAGVLSGTPTRAGTSTMTIRGTDAVGCFAEVAYTMVIPAAVPTLPEWGALFLAVGLAAVGYVMLRRRRRGAGTVPAR